MTKRRRTIKMGAVKWTLAAGGIAATMVGADLMARGDWLATVIDESVASQLEPALISQPQAFKVVIPTVVPYSSQIRRPDAKPLEPKALPEVAFDPIPTVAVPELLNTAAVAGGVSNASATSTGAAGASLPSISFGEIPQVAQPNIPNRPNISTSTVSIDLAPIPEVASPPPAPAAPVAQSTSSKG